VGVTSITPASPDATGLPHMKQVRDTAGTCAIRAGELKQKVSGLSRIQQVRDTRGEGFPTYCKFVTRGVRQLRQARDRASW